MEDVRPTTAQAPLPAQPPANTTTPAIAPEPERRPPEPAADTTPAHQPLPEPTADNTPVEDAQPSAPQAQAQQLLDEIIKLVRASLKDTAAINKAINATQHLARSLAPLGLISTVASNTSNSPKPTKIRKTMDPQAQPFTLQAQPATPQAQPTHTTCAVVVRDVPTGRKIGNV